MGGSHLCRRYRSGISDLWEHWLAIPHAATPPKQPLLKIVRKIGKVTVKMFDREKTVIDAFRYLSKETAIKALRAYVEPQMGRKPDFKNLDFYARELRVLIDPYVLSVTT